MASSYQRLDDPLDHRQRLLPSPQYPPYQAYPIVDPVASQEHDRRLKIRVRQFRIVIRTVAFACSYLPLSLVFHRTATLIEQGVPAWPAHPKLWPTYVMLGVASLSAFLATMVLIGYCWSVRAANRWNTARFTLTVITIGFGLVMWAVAAVGTNNTSDFEGIGTQSLWSATCDATAQQLQYFDKDIDFRRFCIEQQWGVICAFIGIGLETLTAISYIWVFARMRHRQRMKEAAIVPLHPMQSPPVYINPPSPVSSPQPYQQYFDRRPYRPGGTQVYGERPQSAQGLRDARKDVYREA